MSDKKRYEIKEVFNMLGKEALTSLDDPKSHRKKVHDSIEVDGLLIYKNSYRYRLFYQTGIKCSCCGKEATHFEITKTSQKRGHFDLYDDDGMLFTKDHIIPKSRGGLDCLDNFQTMCYECNKNKGTSVETLDADNYRYAIKHKGTKEIRYFQSKELMMRFLAYTYVKKSNRKKKEVINMALSYFCTASKEYDKGCRTFLNYNIFDLKNEKDVNDFEKILKQIKKQKKNEGEKNE